MSDDAPSPFDDKPNMLVRMNQAMIGTVPFNKALGLRVVDYGPGEATVILPYRAELVGDVTTGVLAGGMITGAVDAACGLAVFIKLKTFVRIATLDLRIDYMRPARPGLDVRVRAECYRTTRQIAFVRAVAFHDDPGDLVASSAGTFMIFATGASPIGNAIQRDSESAGTRKE